MELISTVKNPDGTFSCTWMAIKTDPYGTQYKELEIHTKTLEGFQNEVDSLVARIAGTNEVLANAQKELDEVRKLK